MEPIRIIGNPNWREGQTEIFAELTQDAIARIHISEFPGRRTRLSLFLHNADPELDLDSATIIAAAILINQFFLENGMDKKGSMKFINWSCFGYGQNGFIHDYTLDDGSVLKNDLEWNYNKPMEPDALLATLRKLFEYIVSFPEAGIERIDFEAINKVLSKPVDADFVKRHLNILYVVFNRMGKKLDEGLYGCERYTNFYLD